MSTTPGPPSLTGRTASGFAWMFVTGAAGRVISAVGQIVLAWLILPEEFGLIGMAYTVTAFAEQVRAMGVREVLVRRQERFERWATVGFWLAISLGFLGAIIICALAPVVARLYEAPRLQGVVILLALLTPLRAAATAPLAKLQNDLRFRAIALIESITVTGTIVLTILSALAGAGVYSFVFGPLAATTLQVVLLWRSARVRIGWRPHIKYWRYLIGDSVMIFLSAMAGTLTWQAAAIALGRFHSPDAVGLYYFSFRLTSQFLQQLAYNLSQVLFPALTRLKDDPPRQAQAFLRACRLLALMVFPLCFLQAVAAAPATRLFLADRWLPAIPIIQILSLGAAARVVSHPSLSLIQAQGRFRTLVAVSVAQALVMVGLVFAAAKTGDVVTVAIAAAASFAIMSPVQSLTAIWAGVRDPLEIVRVYAVPLVAATVACTAGYFAGEAMIPAGTTKPLAAARIAVITIVSGAVYLPAIWIASPGDVRDLIAQGQEIVRSRRGRGAAKAE